MGEDHVIERITITHVQVKGFGLRLDVLCVISDQ